MASLYTFLYERECVRARKRKRDRMDRMLNIGIIVYVYMKERVCAREKEK